MSTNDDDDCRWWYHAQLYVLLFGSIDAMFRDYCVCYGIFICILYTEKGWLETIYTAPRLRWRFRCAHPDMAETKYGTTHTHNPRALATREDSYIALSFDTHLSNKTAIYSRGWLHKSCSQQICENVDDVTHFVRIVCVVWSLAGNKTIYNIGN